MKSTNNKPEIGSIRCILKFAWFPKSVDKKRTTVWLEKYVSRQIFDMWKVPGPGYKGTRTVMDWKEIDAWTYNR